MKNIMQGYLKKKLTNIKIKIVMWLVLCHMLHLKNKLHLKKSWSMSKGLNNKTS